MLIGTKNIADFQAEQRRVTIGRLAIANESVWARGSPIPVLFSGTLGFKTIKIEVMVRGANREEILNNGSNLLSALIGPVDLTLDGFSHKFRAVLTKSSYAETVMERWHIHTLELSGYEYSDQETQTQSQAESMTIVNPGNIETPLILELTPTFGIASLTITGIARDPNTGEDEPVTLKNLTTGNTVILDGETGLITEGGALKTADMELWGLPTLLPGSNLITFSSDTLNVTAKYKPRYM